MGTSWEPLGPCEGPQVILSLELHVHLFYFRRAGEQAPFHWGKTILLGACFWELRGLKLEPESMARSRAGHRRGMRRGHLWMDVS